MENFPNKDTQFKEGNPGGGRPKGRRSLSTIIKDILENDINWDLVPIKNAQELAQKYQNKKAWEALVYSAYAQAMSGNVKAAAWLSKSGYGDKLDITTKGRPIPILSSKSVEEIETEEEDESS